jgi:hypothetical protein
MATREQLEKALRNADAAGDTSAARLIAAEIKKIQTAGQRQPEEVKAEYEGMPWYQKAATAAQDVARMASNSVTFGGRDALAGALLGRGLEGEKAMTEEARTRAGSASVAAEVLPALALYKNVPGTGQTLANAIPKSMPVTRGGAAVAGGALEGSAVGGLQALMEGRDVTDGQVSGAGAGALGQVGAGILAKGGEMLGRAFTKNPNRMSVNDLFDAKGRAYQDMERMGVEIKPNEIDDLVNRVKGATRKAYQIRHPQTLGMRDQIAKELQTTRTVQPRTPVQQTPLGPVPSPQPVQVRNPVSLPQVDAVRQSVNENLTKMPDGGEAHFGPRITKQIDNWLDNLNSGSVTTRSGSPEAGVEKLLEARGLNSRMRKLEQVDEAVVKAGRRSARNLTGDEASAVKANVESILNDKKKRLGFTPDELAQMEELVRGTPGLRAMRQIGRAAPGSGQSWGFAGSGAALGGLLTGGSPAGVILGGLTPPTVGYGAKKAADAGTRRATNKLLDLVASGGNKAAMRPGPTIDRAQQEQLARFLMLIGQE